MPTNSTQHPERIVREPELLEIVGLSRSSVYRQERAGTFPQRRQIGPHSVGWLYSHIQRWMENSNNSSLSKEEK